MTSTQPSSVSQSDLEGQIPQPIIRLEQISKIYGSGETEVRALDGVDLIVNPGEYCSIMGASGSGKSTMMNMIGCLDRPTLRSVFSGWRGRSPIGRY